MSWVLVVLVAALYTLAGVAKLTGAASGNFAGWGYPAWFALVIGILETAGAIGLLIPVTMRWAAYGLTIVMVGAAYTHLASAEGLQVLRPVIFTAIMWTALYLRKHPPFRLSGVGSSSSSQSMSLR